MRVVRFPSMPWRHVGALLPTAALVGGGAALAAQAAEPAAATVAQADPQVTVPSTPLQQSLGGASLPPLPAIPPIYEAPTPIAPDSATQLPPSVIANGIPQQALSAYQRAAAILGQADPQCHLDWALIGAIGKVESDHGRYGGNGLDAAGTARPGIYGIPLNGANGTALVRDSDGGTYDRDTTFDRAVGPMQFIPGTWRSAGVDADGDGTKNPQNMSDAATAAAVYLCSGPGDLTDPSDLTSAILRYNNSMDYVRKVTSIANSYRSGFNVLPATPLPESNYTREPYLPPAAASSSSSQSWATPGATPGASSQKPSATASQSPSSTGTADSGSGSGSDSGGSSPTATSSDPLEPVTSLFKKPVPTTATSAPAPTSTSTSPSPTQSCYIDALGVRICLPL